MLTLTLTGNPLNSLVKTQEWESRIQNITDTSGKASRDITPNLYRTTYGAQQEDSDPPIAESFPRRVGRGYPQKRKASTPTAVQRPDAKKMARQLRHQLRIQRNSLVSVGRTSMRPYSTYPPQHG
jgi:hypothetical protein